MLKAGRQFSKILQHQHRCTCVQTDDLGKNFAYKGIATRLDPGPGGVSRGQRWMIFDHDTMRMAAAWTGTGFIDWQGIHFDAAAAAATGLWARGSHSGHDAA